MRHRTSLIAVAACTLLALACVAYPLYVIRPFRAQGAAELDAALLLLRVRPLLTLACVAVALAAAASAWRKPAGWWRRTFMGFGVLLTALAAAASRVNLFERMFRPMNTVQLETAAQTKLDSDEMVLAIRLAGEARAYPVRSLGYHHTVNDTVGDTPIVATY